MKRDDVVFRFDDNGRFHDDLILHLGDSEWRCDSYYLSMDDAILPGRDDAIKVREVLRRLLEQWCSAVTGLRDGEACFLPYDFSDAYIGGLKCRAAGSLLRIQRGFAEVNGYAVAPSDVGELLHDVPGFRADGEALIVERGAFLRSILHPQETE